MSQAIASTSKAVAPGKPAVKKLRPARKQVAPDQIDKSEGVQTGKEYNIWYNKWAGGDREDSYHTKTHSQSKCVLLRDAGYTRADANGTKYCCVFFARGCCPLGHQCKYLHRLPLPNHIIPDTSLDCFGREKHADYRDDMGGVGSFGRQNFTLYVGKMREGPSKNDTEEMVRRHFGEWGEIVRLNILQNRGVAFVTYRTEHQAEFAREAMANQSLDAEEILNVRWATEDPNPAQIRVEKRRIEKLGEEGIAKQIDSNLVEAVQSIRALEEGEEENFYPIESPADAEDAERSSKRPRVENGKVSDGGVGGGGLFGGDAMDNIKYFAEQARKQAEEARAASAAAASKPIAKAAAQPAGMGALGGYGSDSD